MPKYQLLGCHIALAGDPRAIVSRGKGNDPVTYPEVMVLQQVHGYDSVTDIHEVGFLDEDRPAVEERRRLAALYSEQPVNDVFGGNASALPVKGDFPTLEDVEAAHKAAEEALERRRARKSRVQNDRTANLKVEAAPMETSPVEDIEEV